MAESWADIATACARGKGVTPEQLAEFDRELRAWADPVLLYLWTSERVAASVRGLGNVMALRSPDEDPTKPAITKVDLPAVVGATPEREHDEE